MSGYRDNNGIEHESYEAACHYYGADSPADLRGEAEFFEHLEKEAWEEHCLAHGLFASWEEHCAATEAAIMERINTRYPDGPF